jgi:hypothetical protein
MGYRTRRQPPRTARSLAEIRSAASTSAESTSRPQLGGVAPCLPLTREGESCRRPTADFSLVARLEWSAAGVPRSLLSSCRLTARHRNGDEGLVLHIAERRDEETTSGIGLCRCKVRSAAPAQRLARRPVARAVADGTSRTTRPLAADQTIAFAATRSRRDHRQRPPDARPRNDKPDRPGSSRRAGRDDAEALAAARSRRPAHAGQTSSKSRPNANEQGGVVQGIGSDAQEQKSPHLLLLPGSEDRAAHLYPPSRAHQL